MNSLTRPVRVCTTASALMLGSALTASVATGGNNNNGDGDEEELPFDEAQLYFELNDTDGDLGIHSLVDGDDWKRLILEDPRERVILDVLVKGRLRQQGLTEIFFESAEPRFDELDPRDFFRRFPEGTYEYEAITLDGDELEGEMELSHVMPAPPANVEISGTPAAANCDADPLPSVSADEVTLSWAPVTSSHPDIGKDGAVEVEKYQVVLEAGDLVLSADLPPDLTSFEFPASFIELEDEFKFEIIVRASTGNQTAVESCFTVE